ncbi:MAG: 50S ribosomal protein L5 [Candidatus Bathyarchaeia archaeon]
MPINPMLKPRIEKVTVNISVGKSGESLERAMKVLEQLTGQKPCPRKAKKTIRDFGIRKGEPIACMVTLRGARATTFLKRAFEAVGNRISEAKFDLLGNFSFGIKEHIEIPGTKYFPELGIFGMDVAVTLRRLGNRVATRHRKRSKIGSRHRLTKNEAMQFVKEVLGVEIVKEE